MLYSLLLMLLFFLSLFLSPIKQRRGILISSHCYCYCCCCCCSVCICVCVCARVLQNPPIYLSNQARDAVSSRHYTCKLLLQVILDWRSAAANMVHLRKLVLGAEEFATKKLMQVYVARWTAYCSYRVRRATLKAHGLVLCISVYFFDNECPGG